MQYSISISSYWYYPVTRSSLMYGNGVEKTTIFFGAFKILFEALTETYEN